MGRNLHWSIMPPVNISALRGDGIGAGKRLRRSRRAAKTMTAAAVGRYNDRRLRASQ